ncbi:MAG: AI-2E family transporter [Tepidisphaeraceae bacterium]
MQRFNIRWLGLLAITLIAIYLCWLIVLPFIDVIIWSVVLAVIFFPFHQRVQKRVPSPPWAASLITVLAIVLLAVLPIALLSISAASQVPEGVEMAKNGVVKFKEFMAGESWTAKTIHKYADPYLTNPDALSDQLKSYASGIVGKSINVAGQAVGVLFKFAFTLFTLFYLLRDADKISGAAIKMLPLEESQARAVFKRCRDVIKASVQGVMVIAAIQGVMGGIAFAALGLPSAVLWGFVMFMASLIPMAGSAIVWGPAALLLLISGSWVKAVILVVIGGGVIGSIDNVLRPKLVGSKAGLHDLTIFFSVLGGLQAFGVAGLFVGPVVVALTLAIIEAFKQMNPVGPAKLQSASKLLVESSGEHLEPIAMVDAPVIPESVGEPAIIMPGSPTTTG